MMDLSPENLHQVTEVLRVAEFHPLHCNILAYGTSAGAVRVCDMRASALCDASWRPLGDGEADGNAHIENKLMGYPSSSRGPLDAYMQGVSDIAFSQAGVHVAARDYGQIRVWDLRVEDRPLARFPVMERHQLLAHLYDKFEDGVPIDCFRCTFLSGDSLYPILPPVLTVCLLIMSVVVVVVREGNYEVNGSDNDEAVGEVVGEEVGG